MLSNISKSISVEIPKMYGNGVLMISGLRAQKYIYISIASWESIYLEGSRRKDM